MNEMDKRCADNLNTKPDYCADCGEQLRGTDEMCPHCGLWIEAHDNTIIHDPDEATRRRECYNKSKKI